MIMISFCLQECDVHYGRSCVAYIGGVCSKEKGIGVNEVRLTQAGFLGRQTG